MTFSQEIKNEICNAKLSCKSCQRAMIYGMLMCCRGIKEDSITLNIENKGVVDFFTASLIDLTGTIVTVKSPNIRNRTKRPLYTISIDDKNDVDKIISYFFNSIEYKHTINETYIEKTCCKIAFLRGVYLICGTMINPQNEYHFEFSLSSERICNQILEILTSIGIEFKKTFRNKNFVLYIKESNQIEDMLTYLGAMKSSINLMNLKIEKELRNQVNRVTNCETANIGKTVNASMGQIEKITMIKETIGFDALPIQLQDIAIMRLMNPEASLRELCLLSGNTISRSGLNHRLKKIIEIADNLED
ncbi:MAG: DNA-binding protein WhiA [Oscillospiraceae bacterium]